MYIYISAGNTGVYNSRTKLFMYKEYFLSLDIITQGYIVQRPYKILMTRVVLYHTTLHHTHSHTYIYIYKCQRVDVVTIVPVRTQTSKDT